jgi:hypothetical protein
MPMPRVGFEPTIPEFELAKTFGAVDLMAAVIGVLDKWVSITAFQGNTWRICRNKGMFL